MPRTIRKWCWLTLLVASPVFAIKEQSNTVGGINGGNGGLRAAGACEVKRQEVQRARADESASRAELRQLMADARQVCRGG